MGVKEGNMIELTEAQQRALDEEQPLRMLDPRTGTPYLLVRQEAYERLRALLEDDTIQATAELVDRVMAEDDANDPYLAEYQRLYPQDRQ
jgi:hypothetical protein